MRVILDTNVWVSGIFWSGPPYLILKAWQAHTLRLVLSPDILAEYDRVAELLAEKYPAIDISRLMALLAFNAEIVAPIQLTAPISRDPEDDKFIACALAADVSWIISGDDDLLSLGRYQSVHIISPADFVKQYLNS